MCSAGSVVESFNGSKQDVILIVHQAAHIPTSNSILSNVQMRAHGCKVDDTSIKHKGEQCITTSGGYTPKEVAARYGRNEVVQLLSHHE